MKHCVYGIFVATGLCLLLAGCGGNGRFADRGLTVGGGRFASNGLTAGSERTAESMAAKQKEEQPSPQEQLKGNLVLHDRFETDGWVFEWLVSDYIDENIFLEGGGGTWIGNSQDRFKYLDVNFDQLPDLLICTGGHGSQMAVTYYCFLQTEEEIIDLLYGENSQWKLADDRWRTLYNDGMTADFSIYDEP